MNFPKFNGKRPKEWVYKAEQYFICQEITKQHRVRLAKMYLEEDAMEWYCFWEEDFPNATWEVFKDELLLRFGDTTYVNHEIKLRNLKQTSIVQDYQTKFKRLSSMVKNQPVESKIAHFIGGLSEDIQIEMLRDRPTELRKCFALAKVIEEQFKRRDARKKAYKPGFVAKPNTNVMRTAPPKKQFEKRSVFRNNVPVKYISQQEREERIKKGLCFYCDEQFQPGHKCKQLQLYEVVESEDELEANEEIDTDGTEVAKVEEEAEEQEEVLCHALTNNGLNAMKVVGKINNQKVTVLLDTGSTHNFLNSRLAHLVEGKVTPQASLNVLVGNGERMSCNKVCKNVSLEMLKTPFTLDLYLLPIGGVDVVLGIQWMKPLKRTLLDWENMTLSFPKEGGGEVTLEAINPSVDPKSALWALIANQPAFWLVSMVQNVIPSTAEEEDRPAEIQSSIAKAQAHMRQFYNKGRKDREFSVGDYVWLKRLPFKQKSLLWHSKLLPKYYGPYQVLQRVGKAAYRIALPPAAQVHPVFHMTRLKPHRGPLPRNVEHIPNQQPTPYRILKHWYALRDGRQRHEVLIEWEGPDGGPSWEELDQIRL
ncbi:hypothetical protein EJ110_NYTH52125 [Nymphaea thermarum]|nr:hypothetical protein EJ110_NYTH52125 [Nymphaea thermarum]